MYIQDECKPPSRVGLRGFMQYRSGCVMSERRDEYLPPPSFPRRSNLLLGVAARAGEAAAIAGAKARSSSHANSSRSGPAPFDSSAVLRKAGVRRLARDGFEGDHGVYLT